MKLTVAGGKSRFFCKNVGYKSCVPWLKELKANINTIRKAKIPAWDHMSLARGRVGFWEWRTCNQAGDSSTLLRMKMTKTAGSAPMTNMPRQPTKENKVP